MMNHAALIIDELRRLDPRAEVRNNDVVIRCPYHKDHSPSFSVRLQDGNGKKAGWYNCWSASCGAHGHWNRLAEDHNLRKLATVYDYEKPLEFVQPKLEASYSCLHDLSSLGSIDWVRHDGVITNKTLKAFHARRTSCWNRKYLYLPVEVGHRVVGDILALRGKRTGNELKYVNSAGPWTSKHWFGFEQARKFNSSRIFIVEGPADAMMMWQHGLPALALMGNTWSDTKRKIVETWWETAYLLLDSDEAGRAMKCKIKESLQIDVKTIRLPEGTDPASASERTYNKLKELT